MRSSAPPRDDEASRRIGFGDMYCSSDPVGRITTGRVHCIGIPIDSTNLAVYRKAVTDQIIGAHKGYEGSGHMSMAYFDEKYRGKYADIVDANKGLMKDQHFLLTEVEMRRPDRTFETIHLYK